MQGAARHAQNMATLVLLLHALLVGRLNCRTYSTLFWSQFMIVSFGKIGVHGAEDDVDYIRTINTSSISQGYPIPEEEGPQSQHGCY